MVLVVIHEFIDCEMLTSAEITVYFRLKLSHMDKNHG